MAECYVNRAYFAFSEHDIAASTKEIDHAFSLDPKNVMVLRNAGFNNLVLGRIAEAINMCIKAIALDPVQPVALSYLAYAYYFHGDAAKADSCFQKRKEISATYRANFGVDAFVTLEALGPSGALKNFSVETDEVRRLFGSSIALASINKSQAIDSLRKLERKYSREYPARIALGYAHLQDKGAAFHWLTKAVHDVTNTEADLTFLKAYPQYNKMRDDPRFTEILKKMKFPE